MFNSFKINESLVESVKKIMAENEKARELEAALNEQLDIQSKKALPHEYHAAYDEMLEEAKKTGSISEGSGGPLDSFNKKKSKAAKKNTAPGVRSPERQDGTTPDDNAELTIKKKITESSHKERVSIKHDHGVMVVSKGHSSSYIIHPKDHSKIASLDHMDSHKFVDETNSSITATRDNDSVHLKFSKQGRDNHGVSIPFSHFKKADGSIKEEIRSNLQERFMKVYESDNEENLKSFMESLTEEQSSLLGLNEGMMDWIRTASEYTPAGIASKLGRSTAQKYMPDMRSSTSTPAKPTVQVPSTEKGSYMQGPGGLSKSLTNPDEPVDTQSSGTERALDSNNMLQKTRPAIAARGSGPDMNRPAIANAARAAVAPSTAPITGVSYQPVSGGAVDQTAGVTKVLNRGTATTPAVAPQKTPAVSAIREKPKAVTKPDSLNTDAGRRAFFNNVGNQGG